MEEEGLDLDPSDTSGLGVWLSDLLSCPSYTLVAGMVCGLMANLLIKYLPGPATRPITDLAGMVRCGPGKMVLVVRSDLRMQKGKVAAQVAHAAVLCYKKGMAEQPEVVRAWEQLGQTKVCVKVDSEESLLGLAAQAKEAGLVFGVVRDAGRTQVDAGSLTVLGIGPGPASAVELITGHLKLY